MLKLYILYIVLGFYVLYYGLLAWVFPFDGAILQVYLALAASAVLYFIAPAIALYKPRIAPAIGLICLAGISPFGLHWVQNRMMDEYYIMWKPENILMYAAILWYLITLIVTINVYTVRQNLKPRYYSKQLKLSLSILPLLIFFGLVIYFWLEAV